jgi:hypothetical protein
MPATYDCIATTTLGSAQGSVTFSSIPSTFTDLVLVISTRTSGGNAMTYQLNTDSTASNYSQTALGGDGSTAFSFRQSLNTLGAANSSAFNVYRFNFQNYSNTTTFKTVLASGGNASADVRSAVSLWRNTSAINQIILAMYSGETFQSGSTFTLYGIKSA